MKIDNSWLKAKMKQKKQADLITAKLAQYGLTWYIAFDDRKHEYTILPKNWIYPINWLLGRSCMRLNTNHSSLWLYNIKYKDAAINLLENLEIHDGCEYTLNNDSSEVIEL